MTQIVCFGECMVELSRTLLGGQSWHLGYAGDSYNVAVYLARLGQNVTYMTALGDDEFSSEMRAEWARENVGADLTLTHKDRIVGLYAIRVDDQGERSFTYWRGESAARAFFECSGAGTALAQASKARLLYVSGITLSLFTEGERARIYRLAEDVRHAGGWVAFDTNFRPKGWSDAMTARRAIEGFGRLANIALPTLEDDVALFGDQSAEACAARWLRLGVTEVAVKMGGDGCHVATRDEQRRIAGQAVPNVRDTTGAGDSFNAGYLAARLAGHNPTVAAETGNKLAAVVVQHPGAILPRAVMPGRIMPAASVGQAE
jgi:2-dehydro-3-deoxygluconokinase